MNDRAKETLRAWRLRDDLRDMVADLDTLERDALQAGLSRDLVREIREVKEEARRGLSLAEGPERDAKALRVWFGEFGSQLQKVREAFSAALVDGKREKGDANR